MDLADAGKGDGRHAFCFHFDPPLSSYTVPTIRLADVHPTVVLSGSLHRQFPAPEFAPILQERPKVLARQLEGHVETISSEEIVGWAFDRANPQTRVEVAVVLNGEVLVSDRATAMREDLALAGKGDGRHGFCIQLRDLPDDEVQRIEVRFVETNEPLDTKQTIRVANREKYVDKGHSSETQPSDPRPDFEGYVDSLNRSSVKGWVWSPQDPGREIWVEALVGDRIVGRALARDMREDLLAYGKGTGLYGYTIFFDRFLTEDETPLIRVAPSSLYLLKNDKTLSPLPESEKASLVRANADGLIKDHIQFTNPGPDYEDVQEELLSEMKPKPGVAVPLVMAYYLPQFHRIPENDYFWGKGFTEWRQLARGLPRFPGHYQPRIPRDLGFYELGQDNILREQAKMAKNAGVTAFCYYYYWFNGQKVLDWPIEAHLASDVDMPFLLMWANENWTRTWDGYEADVLLRQEYRAEDEDALLADFARHFDDPRYVRLDGRPLFIIYNPGHIPELAITIRRWRDKLKHDHGHDPILFMAQAFAQNDPRPYGLDGAIEFPPHKLSNQYPGREMPDAYSAEFTGRVIKYDDFVMTSLLEETPEYPLIKTAVPSWDNDARRPNRGLVLEKISPRKYEAWICGLVQKALSNPVFGQPVIAINAWNEWAEAAYLEPDVYFGGAFLNATARGIVAGVNGYEPAVFQRARDMGVTVVLPCYNHAQFLPERIGSILNQTIPPDEILFLDDCSTDDSVAVAERLLEGGNIPYRIVRNETNSGGVFHQWIKGLDMASHGLIWVAETDDSVDPAFLEHLLPAFEREDVLAAYGQIRCIDPQGQLRNDLDDYFDGLRDVTWSRSWTLPAPRIFQHDFTVRNIIPNASGLVFRKPQLSDTEKQRLIEYRFAGDWYFYALMLRGGALAYRPQAKSYFRVNPNSASRSSFFTDAHLAEHQMILEDIQYAFGVSPDALNGHCQKLAVYFPGQDTNVLLQRFRTAIEAVKGERPLHLCIIAHSFAVGGGEVLPVELANKLRSRGHHVSYIVMEHELPQGAANVRHRLRNDIPVFYWSQVSSNIERFFEDYAIDVLNTHNVSADVNFFWRGKAPNRIWIASLHGGYETVPKLITPSFVDYLNQNVSEWLHLCDRNKSLLTDRGVEEDAFCQSFNAIADTGIDWVDRAAFRADHGIPQDAFCLMICSRAIPEKGWLIAVEVAQAAAKRTGKDVHICLIGSGPVEEELRQTMADHPRVHVLGFVPDPIRTFRSFDLGIFPSTYSGESFPLFLLECFEAGLPVITTSVGEIPKIMGQAPSVPGAVVDWTLQKERIVQIMTDHVVELLADPSVMERAVVSSRETAKAYSMNRLADFYLGRIQTLRKIHRRTCA